MDSKHCDIGVKSDEGLDRYRIVSRATENPSQLPNPQMASPLATVTPVAVGPEIVKKKPGRPRKYGPDGPPRATLSPMPISSSIPFNGDFSMWKPDRQRQFDPIKKSNKFYFESTGDKISYSPGSNFTPHIITVKAGEDVTMKIMSISQQGARAICVLSANGTISNVTLRQPTCSGGTLTYEGHFELLSLSGSYIPIEMNGGTKSRSGGMSVSLAGPDGRVVGGGLAGLLIAAGPVQVVAGSFLPFQQQEQKRQRTEAAIAATPITYKLNVMPEVSGEEPKVDFSGNDNGTSKPSHGPFPFFNGNNSVASMNPPPLQGRSNSAVDEKTSSLEEDDPKGVNNSNYEVSS